MVQEIHQVLMDREDTCHRTCFSLQLDGNVLDNFAELKSIEGLQEGSLLKVVEGTIQHLLSQVFISFEGTEFLTVLFPSRRALHSAWSSHTRPSHQRPAEEPGSIRRL